MASFSPQFLDELRARVSLEDVVGRRVKLIRKGREYVGLSPFQKEKTPSFTVVPDKGFYHCFSSGENGDVIDFVMKTEGLNFPEAVERLAAEAGLEMPVDSPEERERAQARQGLIEVLEAAAVHFEKMLRMPEGKRALDYLKGRGLSDETISRFRLGVAPDQRGGLKAALAREGIGENLMLTAGLIRQPDDGRAPYDYFRGRVLFPITDRCGRVIAFGGRILGDGEPKYLNSPESPVFTKRHVLYGLSQSLRPARDAGTMIVTEGYMDVIALHQAGFENAVAPLGTALTEDQIQVLWKIVPEPVLCFDGDTAGRKAALRVAERALPLLKAGFGMRFAELPGGEDPDSLIASKGRESMEGVVANAQAYSDVLWRMEAGDRQIRTPEDFAALQKRLEAKANQIGDPIVRSHFLSFLKSRVWEGTRAARDRGPRRRAGTPPGPVVKGAGRPIDRDRLIHRQMLAVMINHPALFDEVGERLGRMAFGDGELDDLRQKTVEVLSENPDMARDRLYFRLEGMGCKAALEALFNDPMVRSNRLIRVGAELSKARELWAENEALLQKAELVQDVDRVPSVLSEELTKENWGRARPVITANLGDDSG
ncbi:MAG: DNA primase [Rhodospirillales bacterium]|nr:DNA primase [Rhodospirillales bacterium]